MVVQEADFDFQSKQTTAVTGQNGGGKSTLLYAVAFCLTGYKKGDTYRNYVRLGASEAKVSLDGVFNGDPIHYDITVDNMVHRTVSYRGMTYTNSEYSQFLKEYKIEELCDLMFMFQGTTSIIDAGARERADRLKKLFKTEFPDIVAKLRQEQDSAKEQNLQLQAAKDELSRIQAVPQALLREKAEPTLAGYRESLEEAKAKLSRIQAVDVSELKSLDEAVENCDRQISGTEAKLRESEKALSDLNDRTSEVEQRVLKQDLRDLEADQAKAKAELDGHREAYARTKAEYDRLSDSLKELSFKDRELSKQYKVSLTGVCHACGQSIDERHTEALKVEMEEVSRHISETEVERTALGFDPSDREGKALEAGLKGADQAIEAFVADLKVLGDGKFRRKELESMVADRSAMLESFRNKRSDLSARKAELEALLPLLEERDRLSARVEGLEAELRSAEEVRIKNIERREANARLARERDERDARLQDMSEKMNELSSSMARLKTEIDIFNVRFPNYITLQACNKLEDYINSVVQKVFPYCHVSLRLENTGLGVFYTTESSRGDYIPISMASGCQRQILALAYFIALARMSGVTCIFLDEIDASSSADNAKVIYDFIAELDCFDQVFFISHRPEAYQAVKEHNEDLVTYTVEDGRYQEI